LEGLGGGVFQHLAGDSHYLLKKVHLEELLKVLVAELDPFLSVLELKNSLDEVRVGDGA
jgi:hypothetical protein